MMLEVKDVSFYYKQDRMILHNISFCLETGDVLCILGPNGTGKTTLLRCLLSLNRIKGGEIRINGRNMEEFSYKRRAQLMAYVPQSASIFFPYEVHEVVLMGRVAHQPLGRSLSARDRAVAEEVMERLSISHLSNRLFQQLSGGERQMVLVARALAQQADILIMDEPTANLDYGNQVKMLKLIKELSSQNYAILMTTHFPDHAFLACTRVALMRDGGIMAQGLPDDIVTTSNLTELYQTLVRVIEAPGDGPVSNIKACVPIINE